MTPLIIAIVLGINILLLGFFLPEWKWYTFLLYSVEVLIFQSNLTIIQPATFTSLIVLILAPLLCLLVGYLIRIILDLKN